MLLYFIGPSHEAVSRSFAHCTAVSSLRYSRAYPKGYPRIKFGRPYPISLPYPSRGSDRPRSWEQPLISDAHEWINFIGPSHEAVSRTAFSHSWLVNLARYG